MDVETFDRWVREQWYGLLAAFSADRNLIDSVFREVVTSYDHENRAYHTLAHIKKMLQLAAVYRKNLHDPILVNLAIYFHDLIYTPGSSENEEKSAKRARKVLPALNVPKEKVENVCRYIMATKDHLAVKSPGNDLKYFLDFDLSILSADHAEYEQYAANVRKEYYSLPDTVFAAGRAAFLKKLLQVKHIYFTDEFRKKEPMARENIALEIKNLPIS